MGRAQKLASQEEMRHAMAPLQILKAPRLSSHSAVADRPGHITISLTCLCMSDLLKQAIQLGRRLNTASLFEGLGGNCYVVHSSLHSVRSQDPDWGGRI